MTVRLGPQTCETRQEERYTMELQDHDDLVAVMLRGVRALKKNRGKEKVSMDGQKQGSDFDNGP